MTKLKKNQSIIWKGNGNDKRRSNWCKVGIDLEKAFHFVSADSKKSNSYLV